MSYVVFGDSFTFPEGNAATNRVHTYAKGFYENGIIVHVICFENEYLAVSDGMINGINYYHPFGQRLRSKYFLIRRWKKFIKYFKTLKLFGKINRTDKIIAVNCWTQRLTTQFFCYVLSRYYGTRIILERSEHPLRNYQTSFLKNIQGKVKTFMESKLCDGIYCISQYLVEFYKTMGLRNNNLLLVPSTVDTGRFQIPYDSPFEFQYILYCGSLTILKDGVNQLIESFEKISGKYPEIKLVLIGKGDNPKDEQTIKELVATLKMESRVIFTGLLPRTEVPAYMKNAKILALARPRSMVADAGFPSKLTEYLSTGNPVIVTEVGEIPGYLTDNKDAFLVMPDNVEAFAEKLDYVLSNYTEAKEVGARGKELTDIVFNYSFQARRMIEYINSLS